MIKKNDFIEIEYTGKTKDEQMVFDTTDEKLAKEEEIFQKGAQYGSAVICIGQGQIIEGLDNKLVDKEEGKDYTIDLQPEEAFGKKSAKLIQLVPTRKFKESEVMPQPGLQVQIDGMNGIIKTVSGGRTLVDFNHPLSGKIIEYDVKIIKKVTDDKVKLVGYLKLALGIKDVKASVIDGIATVTTNVELPKEPMEELSKTIKEIIPTLKEIIFKKEEKKAETKKEEKTESKEETTQK